MIVIDVNVLLAAHRLDHPHHEVAYRWLEGLTHSDERFTVPDLVWASFIRLATNHRIFTVPTPLGDAFAFLRSIRSQPNYLPVRSSSDHIEIFEDVCAAAEAIGDLAADAYLAAITIALGAELVSFDRDFARFDRLRWLLPKAG